MLDKEKISRRCRSPELWLLRLQSASRLGSLTFGLAVGALVFVLPLLPLLAAGHALADVGDILEGALFFSLSIGVLAGCTGPMFRGASADIADLAGVLPLDAAELKQLQAGMTRESRRETLIDTAIGVTLGLLHTWLLDVYQQPLLFAFPSGMGTVLLWSAMFWTVPPLLSNALIFRQLGGMATPDLLRPSRHAAFGRAALRPSLFVIALLCVYPLLAIGDGLRGPVLFGFTATLLCVFGLFFLPLRGIRRRIREVRREKLAALDARADQLYPGDIARADAEQLFELDAVLDIRERVARAPAWPLDLQGVRRILLYVIIPPLTWAAAALLEVYIEQVV